MEPTGKRLRVELDGVVIAGTTRGLRVLETASPPTIYFPPQDVRMDLLRPAGHETVCEWKGVASHFDVVANGRVAQRAAWSYPDPNPGYTEIAGYISFYPGRVDAAWIDDEPVRPQPGGYYGGWMTSDIVGPVKGEPGTGGW